MPVLPKLWKIVTMKRASIACVGPLLLAFLAASMPVAGPALAAGEEEHAGAREALVAYYRLEIALDDCLASEPPEADRAALQSAIAQAERRSGLSEGALDDLYDQVEFETQIESERFCEEQSDAVVRVREVAAQGE
jgi:hypothetical protein